MSRRTVDLNADVGESFGRWRLGDDHALLQVVTSANVACGFHAGDPTTLVQTCRSAVSASVHIGAQVGYRDLAGFGRRFIEVDPTDLEADVLYQLGALDGIARSVGGRVRYVKPHGALYNAVVHHQVQARAVAQAIASYDADLPVLGLPQSVMHREAAALGLRVVSEVFADRGYAADATLVPRSHPQALVTEPEIVAARALRMVTDGEIETVDGSVIAVDPDSVCVHGDSPGAVAMAQRVAAVLAQAGVTLAPFTA